MIHGILASKLHQSQTFTQDGRRIPVTFVIAGPCCVTKIIDTDAYKSLQLSFGTSKYINKSIEGHMHKAGLKSKPRFLREIRVDEIGNDVTVGKEITADQVFTVGDAIRVSGISKGKGFAGVVKRYGFHGGPRTHGQSDRERAPGSIGSGTTPGRVFKGKKMAGRMGSDTVTVRGLSIVSIDPITHIVGIKGLVPGARKGLLVIEKEG